jgi:hypothetical protein
MPDAATAAAKGNGGVVQRLYSYTQHGDHMYGGADKILRFLQYSIGCIGCVLGGHPALRAQFVARQLMAVKREIDRGRCVTRFFGEVYTIGYIPPQLT